MISGSLLPPPSPARKPHEVRLHGQTLRDDYFWLRERDNPEVLEHLRAENAYTAALLNPLQPLQDALFHEMRSRIKETDATVPVKNGPYYYYSRTEKDLQYPIFMRKKNPADVSGELLLDLNPLAAGFKYLALGVFEVSPDHRYLAYSLDREGSEAFTVFVKDLETGALLPDVISNTARSLEWAEDSRVFFYTTLDASKRPHRLYRHDLGGSPDRDALIYEETDEAYVLSFEKTRDRLFFILEAASSTTRECRVQRTADPRAPLTLIHPREKGLEYSLEHHGGQFYILTNDQAVNFRIMAVLDDAPQKNAWTEFYAHRPAVKIEDIHCFQGRMVVQERERGLTRLRAICFSDRSEQVLEFPESVYSVWSGSNPEFDASVFRLHYTSLVSPVSVYDYHFDTRRLELRKQTEVVGGYDASRYRTERIFARSADGTEVPISLVYPAGLVRDGSHALLLYGYGSYGISLDPEFSSNRLSLLDRGAAFALAHVRGGGDLGRPWYDDGKLLRKKNTFQDFIACAELLIREGWTTPQKMAIAGGSAGGLLMGAAVNMRPDLFHAVVAKVPFVDVMNTMMDASLPLTVGEYEEWGNPADPVFFQYMLSYSPYDQIQPRPYPNMLITGGLNDPRVQYWEPAKWAAKLRQYNRSDSVILLKMNLDAGHGGASGRYDYLREIALEYAFLLWQWGKVPGKPVQNG